MKPMVFQRVFRNPPGQSVGLVGPSGGGAPLSEGFVLLLLLFVRAKILYEI